MENDYGLFFSGFFILLQVLQELRDISSMAMEYFDEKIAPNLKIKRQLPLQPLSIPGPSSYSRTISPVVIKDTLRKDFLSIQNRTKRHNITITLMKNLITRLASKVGHCLYLKR